MKYVSEQAIIKRVKDKSLLLYTTSPHRHASGRCTGCGACASRPGTGAVSVDAENARMFLEGQVVTLKRVELPYYLSLFFVFIFPLLCMAGALAVSCAIGHGFNFPFLLEPGSIAFFGFIGLVAAFGINYCIDRKITAVYPPQIIQNTE